MSPSGTSFGSLHRRLRQQTVLRRLNTKHPPGKGPFAVRAAPVLSPWLPSVAPGNRGGGGPGVRFRGARCRRRVLLLLPALPGGRRNFLRRASRAWASAPVGCHRWPGSGGLPGCYFPRPRSILQHTREGAAARQHRQQAPATSPRRKAPWKPRADPVAAVAAPRRESSGVVLAVPPGGHASRDGRQRRAPPPASSRVLKGKADARNYARRSMRM